MPRSSAKISTILGFVRSFGWSAADELRGGTKKIAANARLTTAKSFMETSGRFCRQARDANLLIGVGSGDTQTVRMQIHVAGVGRQLEFMKRFLGVRFPEEKESARDAAAHAHERTIAEPAQPGKCTLRDAFGD